MRPLQTLIADGDPASIILRHAKNRYVEVIFVSSRGLGDAKGLQMGSVSPQSRAPRRVHLRVGDMAMTLRKILELARTAEFLEGSLGPGLRARRPAR